MIGDASIDNCRASSPAETEIMLDKSNTTLRNRLYLLTFAHAVVDAYSTTLPHLLPLLFRKTGVTYYFLEQPCRTTNCRFWGF